MPGRGPRGASGMLVISPSGWWLNECLLWDKSFKLDAYDLYTSVPASYTSILKAYVMILYCNQTSKQIVYIWTRRIWSMVVFFGSQAKLEECTFMINTQEPTAKLSYH